MSVGCRGTRRRDCVQNTSAFVWRNLGSNEPTDRTVFYMHSRSSSANRSIACSNPKPPKSGPLSLVPTECKSAAATTATELERLATVDDGGPETGVFGCGDGARWSARAVLEDRLLGLWEQRWPSEWRRRELRPSRLQDFFKTERVERNSDHWLKESYILQKYFSWGSSSKK